MARDPTLGLCGTPDQHQNYESATQWRRKQHGYKTVVEDYLAFQYQGLVRIYTDGSIRRGYCSSTVAYTGPALGGHWSVNINEFTFSTTAAVIAAKEALRFALSHPAISFVIVCDSRYALQRLKHPRTTNSTTREARTLASALFGCGQQFVSAVDLCPFGNSGKRKIAGPRRRCVLLSPHNQPAAGSPSRGGSP